MAGDNNAVEGEPPGQSGAWFRTRRFAPRSSAYFTSLRADDEIDARFLSFLNQWLPRLPWYTDDIKSR
jgi:hypothetical protein